LATKQTKLHARHLFRLQRAFTPHALLLSVSFFFIRTGSYSRSDRGENSDAFVVAAALIEIVVGSLILSSLSSHRRLVE
jgi:hypothetical protein